MLKKLFRKEESVKVNLANLQEEMNRLVNLRKEITGTRIINTTDKEGWIVKREVEIFYR